MTILATLLLTLTLTFYSIGAFPTEATPESAGLKKIDAALDLVLVPVISSCTKVKAKAYAKLADFFQLGEDKTRVAIVSRVVCEHVKTLVETVVLNLTSDRDVFDRAVSNYTHPIACTGTRYILSLKALQDYITATASVGRVQAVVFIKAHTARYAEPGSENEELSLTGEMAIGKEIRQTGAMVYAVATHAVFPDSTVPKQWAEAVCGDAKRMILVRSADFEQHLEVSMVKIKDLILRDLCRWESLCQSFDPDQRECGFQHWLDPVSQLRDHSHCDEVTPKCLECVDEVCRQTCDALWPWNETTPRCDQHCGETRIRRATRTPPRESLKYCPYTFSCPPCRVKAIGEEILQVSLADGDETQNPLFEIGSDVQIANGPINPEDDQ